MSNTEFKDTRFSIRDLIQLGASDQFQLIKNMRHLIEIKHKYQWKRFGLLDAINIGTIIGQNGQYEYTKQTELSCKFYAGLETGDLKLMVRALREIHEAYITKEKQREKDQDTAFLKKAEKLVFADLEDEVKQRFDLLNGRQWAWDVVFCFLIYASDNMMHSMIKYRLLTPEEIMMDLIEYEHTDECFSFSDRLNYLLSKYPIDRQVLRTKISELKKYLKENDYSFKARHEKTVRKDRLYHKLNEFIEKSVNKEIQLVFHKEKFFSKLP